MITTRKKRKSANVVKRRVGRKLESLRKKLKIERLHYVKKNQTY